MRSVSLAAVALLLCATASAGQVVRRAEAHRLGIQLSLAATKADLQLSARLLQAGADPDAESREARRALFVAIDTDHVDLVRLLLMHHADPNRRDRHGDTPLCDAVDRSEPDAAILDLLLEYGADVNTPSACGTPLGLAAGRGSVETYRYLLAHGADPRRVPRGCDSPLFAAIGTMSPKAEIVADLLARGLAANSRRRRDEATPLQVASGLRGASDSEKAERAAIARLLLDHGADPRAADRQGVTPLMEATAHRYLNGVELLLDRGVDVNAQDKWGQTALGRACLMSEAIIADLLEHGADARGHDARGVTPLMEAVQSGGKDLVRSLLDRGADVRARAKDGRTPLMFAMGPTGVANAEALLAKGADLRARDRDWCTVLMHAAMQGPTPLVRWVLDHGAPVDERDKRGRTALMLVGGGESALTSSIDLLLERGADINARDRDGMTALMHACAEGVEHHGSNVLEILGHVPALLARGADVNARDRSGQTALIHCARARQPDENLAALLEKGADPNATDRRGRTALMWAARYGWDNSVKVLRDRGARLGLIEALLVGDEPAALAALAATRDTDMRGPFEQTPLMLAAAKGYGDIVQELLSRGARVNSRDEYQMTPLHFAVGARVNGISSLEDRTPSDDAGPGDRLSTVLAQLEAGADPDAAFVPYLGDMAGRGRPETAIEWAARLGSADIAEALIEHGADARGKAGTSALLIAQNHSHPDVAALLERAGARADR